MKTGIAQYRPHSISIRNNPLTGKLLALTLIGLIALSPAAIDAFSQIAKMQITQGTMDLQDGYVVIEAAGIKDGVTWEVMCLWENGCPQWILYYQPSPSL